VGHAAGSRAGLHYRSPAGIGVRSTRSAFDAATRRDGRNLTQLKLSGCASGHNVRHIAAAAAGRTTVDVGKSGTHLIKGRVTMKMRTRQVAPMLLAAGLGCAAVGSLQAAESLQDVMKRRSLSQQDILAAAKTYVPTGKRDEFVAFSSGGQSGQVIVYGIPSMRILKYIGVFTPEPWQG